jgi:hypothetical protein
MKGRATKTSLLAVVLVCVAGAAAVSLGQSSDDFQTGKIVAVEKLASTGGTSAGGGTDAPLTSQVDRYNVSIQLNDTIYVCRVKTVGDASLDWVQGKEVQAQAKGNAMYVKRASGKTTKLSIVSSRKAE